ncbi:MAG: acyl carrier protein [Kiritimatiellae bacterium]|nr:acyl carrier protein [Kiritimatiellia bacterium]
MTRDEINEKLRELMKRTSQELVDWNAVTEETAVESLGIDSLAMLDLVYDLQQAFGIEFEPEALIQVKTVGDLTTFLAQRIG